MKIRKVIELGKAERLYIMIDYKGKGIALVKVGITKDTLKNRFHTYRTCNPWLQLVATGEIRKRQSLKVVEKMFFDYLRNEKGYKHVFGEWVLIDNEEDIEQITREGFKFFDKLFYRIKNHTLYNQTICDLWNYRDR